MLSLLSCSYESRTFGCATSKPSLRKGLSRRDGIQLHAQMAIFLDVNCVAAIFVSPQKLGVEVCASINLFPGEKGIVTRNYIPHREPSRLICKGLAVIALLRTSLPVRDQHC